MNKMNQFQIKLEKRCQENYTEPPTDTLGELSNFELGLRRFCYDYNGQVLISIGDLNWAVFLDPDISMLLTDDLPQLIGKLIQGKSIEFEFAETCCVIITLVPSADTINCYVREFGDRTQVKSFQLPLANVIKVWQNFLKEIMELAMSEGYINAVDTNRFIAPAFLQNESAQYLVIS